MSNYFAQTEALMNGKTKDEVLEELSSANLSSEEKDPFILGLSTTTKRALGLYPVKQLKVVL